MGETTHVVDILRTICFFPYCALLIVYCLHFTDSRAKMKVLKVFMQRNFTPTFFDLSLEITLNELVTSFT